MLDFAVNTVDEITGKTGLYMYIGFTEKFSNDHRFISCYGSAFVVLDKEKEYEFDYAFAHTADWIATTEIVLRPAKTYNLGVLLLDQLGGDIVKSIRSFISQWN